MLKTKKTVLEVKMVEAWNNKTQKNQGSLDHYDHDVMLHALYYIISNWGRSIGVITARP